MSNLNETPAAAWYPDPQLPGHVRWWDGATWTDHVSQIAATSAAPAAEMRAAGTVDEQPSATVTYIGRHAAGETPAPRTPATAPRYRSRERPTAPAEARADELLYA